MKKKLLLLYVRLVFGHVYVIEVQRFYTKKIVFLILLSFYHRSEDTVWKIIAFYIIQILCEIKFWDFTSAKSAILTNFEALNFDFYAFLHFLNAEIYQINKIQSP